MGLKQILCAAATILCAMHSGAVTPESAERVVQEYVDHTWFSGNVLIAHKDGKVSAQSYGLANIADNIPNRRDTRFNVGSIAKHYTAVLVLQMIEQGKFSFETTLSEFDLGLDASIAEKITIEHLLTHKAGFGDIFIPAYMNDPLSYDSLDKKLGLLRGKPLLFEPGSDYRYSNYGYIVLGALLEKLTKKSFGMLLNERIFGPTGAKSSSLHREENSPSQSERYVYALDKTLQPTQFREVSGPDGGIEATVDDVYHFFNALFFSDELLNRKGSTFTRYFGNKKHHGSYGGGTGVSAAVEVLRDQQTIIVVLANSDELVAERVSNRLMQMYRQESVDAFMLPAKHFVYDQYKALGLARFKRDFSEIYKAKGYTGFMGRPLNEAGLSLAKSGAGQEALDVISTLSHFYPNAPQAYDSLAYVHYLLGDKSAAQSAFKKAKALSEGFDSDYHEKNYGL
ncbi:serine hydrolase [Alteromonas sediminis]|uniref:Serine hydrolase n=1 Tax=Alteromonas sediminis TaxID=2259342 RepID=A0A3N5XY02_9ALTE|nr:serine hydrolase domain-containing protein [Alteromonas sediminis]RPJ65430.1 serine hydrolase [Alteromonas sediminis]